MSSPEIELLYHFIDGPEVKISSRFPSNDDQFKVTLFNKTENALEYCATIGLNQSAKASKSYFCSWNVRVEHNGNLVLDYDLNLERKLVIISLASSALGDTLAWMPYAEEFRKRHRCDLICATHFNDLFIKAYPQIRFIEMRDQVPNVFAMYRVACWPYFNRGMSKTPWFKDTVQGIAKGVLGLDDLGEVRPKVYLDPKDDIRRFKRLVCIATESTAQGKEWNCPDGWQKLTYWLRRLGYTVVNLSPEGLELDGVFNVEDDEPLSSTMSYLKHCEFFIGLTSGLSWLAWALEKRIVMISGMTEPWHEFKEKVHVGPPKDKCQGCFHMEQIDHGKYDWCPKKKQFECTASITPEMVQKAIVEGILQGGDPTSPILLRRAG